VAAKPKAGYSCALCGKRVREGQYVYSRFTGNRYCIGMEACRARAKKRK